MSSPPRIMTLSPGLEPKYIEASIDEPRVVYVLGGTAKYVYDVNVYEQTGGVDGTVGDGQVFTQDTYLVSDERALVEDRPSPPTEAAILAIGDSLLPGEGITISNDETTGKVTISATPIIPQLDRRAVTKALGTSTAYTLQLADQFTAIHAQAATKTTITIPALGSGAGQVPWDIESLGSNQFACPWIEICRRGAGAVEIVGADATVTLQGNGARPFNITAQYGVARLRLVNAAGGGGWQVEWDLTPQATGGGVVAPTFSVNPSLSPSGSRPIGTTITVANGTISDPAATVSYQWKRDGTTNIGSNSASYTLTSADAAHTITCVVTAANSAGSASATSSNSATGATTTQATPLFDGSTRSAWTSVQVSTPSAAQTTTTPGPNGTDIIQMASDPMGIVPGPVLKFHNVDADHNGDRVRVQALKTNMVEIDGSKTYWMRRIIGIPNGFPLIDPKADVLLGSHFGTPFSGTSALPLAMSNKGGANKIVFGRTASWNTSIWETPATPGTYHKIAVRIRTINYTKFPSNGVGWLELYYAPWGQPMQLMSGLRVADSGGTVVNNGTRLNCQTVLDGHNAGLNDFRINFYRYWPQSNFVGGVDLYHYKSAIYDDAAVAGVAAVDPE